MSNSEIEETQDGQNVIDQVKKKHIVASTGAATGAVIGAVIGGPIGAAIGGGIGGFAGAKVDQQRNQ